jgi:hypothetical protein
LSYLLGGLAIVGMFSAIYFIGERKHRRMARALLQRRPNPTKSEFISLLAPICDAVVADFLWEELLPYFKPILTPHPDDDMVADLPIDPEEPADLTAAFCDRFNIDESNYAHWPEGKSATVRNIACWLASGLPGKGLA